MPWFGVRVESARLLDTCSFATGVVTLLLAVVMGTPMALAALPRLAVAQHAGDPGSPQAAQFQIRIGGGGVAIGGGRGIRRFGRPGGGVTRVPSRGSRRGLSGAVTRGARAVTRGARIDRRVESTRRLRRGRGVTAGTGPTRIPGAGKGEHTPGGRPHRPRRPRPPVIVKLPRLPKPPSVIVTEEPPRRRPPKVEVVVDPPRWRPGRRITRKPPVVVPPVVAIPPVVAPPALVSRPPAPPPRGPSPAAPPAPDDIWPNELVAYIDTTAQPPGTDLAVAQTHGIERVSFEDIAVAGSRLVLYRITDGRSVPALVAALAGDSRVALVAPNYRYAAAQAAAGGPARVEPAAAGVAARSGSLQYALAKLRVPEAQRLAAGRGVTVAVIDSGIDADHPALAGALARRVDFAEGRGEPVDAHGTAIAGIIRAKGEVDGVAPGARIAAARAFFRETGVDRPVSSTYLIARSIYWALGEDARVVNMSFAGPKDPAVAKAVGDALGRGVVLVAAAGNAGAKAPPAYPAAYPGVIAVTAVDDADKLFEAANRGTYVALAAPGVNVIVLAPKGGYVFDQGTSIAAAHVSGVIALLIERQPTLNTDEIRRILAEHAVDLGDPGRDTSFGAGRVDALAAVTAIRSAFARKVP